MSCSVNNFDNQYLYDQYRKKEILFAEYIPGEELFFSMLPSDVTEWTILDLACGNGSFGRRLLNKQVSSVIGYDLSQKMINEAMSLSKHDSRLKFYVTDLETIKLPIDNYNLVHCQFGFHYIADLDRMMSQISNTLLPNGILMFMVPHPILTSNSRTGDTTVELDGHLIYPLCDYLEEGQRIATWLGSQVTRQHHTVSAYVNSCIKNGLDIVEMVEWAPKNPKLRARLSSLMIKAKKRTY